MEQNTHWEEWRSAVKRDGYCAPLIRASAALLRLDEMTPEQVEDLFSKQIDSRQPGNN